MSAAARSRACPMCGSANHVLHRLVNREHVDFRIVRCGACRFVFVAELHAETFRAVQPPPPRVPELPRHGHIKRLLDAHAVHAGKDRPCTVIEVGAGWGGLAQALARDRRYRYVGFEPSASRAAFCRAQGFDVRQELFRGPDSAGTADAVVIDNVLEHVEDPSGLARDAVATLVPGGMLIVIVPNESDLRQLHPRWRARHHWQPHCHINYFSSESLRSLFVKCGLSFRFFGLGSLAGLRDWRTLPRVLADGLGLHPFGLNCYGIKPGPSSRRSG